MPTWLRNLRDWIALILGILGLISYGAGAYQYTKSDLESAIYFLLAAFPLSALFALVFVLPMVRFGARVKKLLGLTEEIREKLSRDAVDEAYSASVEADRQLSDHVRDMLTYTKAVFEGEDDVVALAGGIQRLLEITESPSRLRDALIQFLRIGRTVRKSLGSDVLDGAAGQGREAALKRLAQKLPDVLAEAQRAFEELLNIRGVNVCLKVVHPTESAQLMCVYSQNADPNRAREDGGSVPLEGSIWGDVFNTGGPIVFASQDELGGKYAKETWRGQDEFAQSGIVFPVTVDKDRIVGVLNVDAQNVGALEKRHVPLVQFVADHIAIMFQVLFFLSEIGDSLSQDEDTVVEGVKRAPK